jgi:NADH-quinone oxidoreductase subunit H
MRLAFLAGVVCLAAFATGVGGCARDPAPPLLDVSEVTPHEVERGERLEIRGRGFGEGRLAHLTFRGLLHRPGEEPETATLETSATATSEEAVELMIDERTLALFCRDGDRLDHTTFTGDLDVAFAPAMVGAPPVSAVLHGVRLDVAPPIRERLRDEAMALEGQRVLEDLGLRVDPTPVAAGGFVVREVVDGSAAAKAQLAPGDTLVTVDEVSLDSLADARPGGGTEVVLGVHAAATTATRNVTLPLGALGSTAPRAVTTTATILGLALALLVLFLAPRFAFLDWLELRLAERLQSARRRGRSLFTGTGGPGFLLFATLASVAVLVLPFADSLGLDLDVGLLFVLAVTARIVAALLSSNGIRRRGMIALQTLVEQVPAALALGCVVLLSGSLRLREIVGQQGGAPWDWTVFRTPAALFLVAAFLAAAAAPSAPSAGYDGANASPATSLPEAEIDRRRTSRDARLRATEEPPVAPAHLFVLAVLAAALFFGGWRVPGAGEHGDALGALRLAGAALFVAKAWAIYATARLVQSLLPRLSFAQRMGVAFGALVPWSLLAVAGSAAWALSTPSHAVERVVGTLSFVAVALVAAASGRRIVIAAARDQPVGGVAGHLDPFS